MNTYSSLRKQNNNRGLAVISLALCVVMTATMLFSRLLTFTVADTQHYIPLTEGNGITTVRVGQRQADGSVVYVNRDPMENGDVGIFSVDGEMLCKQYVRDKLGMVYLFSLNRKRADADVLMPPSSGRNIVCLGRVLLPSRPPIPL